jgi:hypothetical protein
MINKQTNPYQCNELLLQTIFYGDDSWTTYKQNSGIRFSTLRFFLWIPNPVRKDSKRTFALWETR